MSSTEFAPQLSVQGAEEILPPADETVGSLQIDKQHFVFEAMKLSCEVTDITPEVGAQMIQGWFPGSSIHAGHLSGRTPYRH